MFSIALDGNFPRKKLDEMLDDKKAKSQTAMHSRRRTISLPEAIENVWQEFRTDADAGITYRNSYVLSSLGGLNTNVATLGRKLDGVAQKIPENLLQPSRIARDKRPRSLERGFQLNV